MLVPFFTLDAVSPPRQRAFRLLVAGHLAGITLVLMSRYLGGPWHLPLVLGNVLLVAGIVEGALLIGWRLTQLPKSQSLEFLLVSPLRPPLVLVAEALVGLTRLALVTLTGTPLLIFLVIEGWLFPDDVEILLVVPFT